MIDPPTRGEPAPGRIPPLRDQVRALPGPAKAALVLPLVVAAIVLAFDLRVGVAVAVLAVGAELATAVYAKNRTDRHNAAVDRGEIPADPGVELVALRARDLLSEAPVLAARLDELEYPLADVRAAWRFEGGWVARRRSRVELGVVVGDDGGHAFFDPRRVTPMRAAAEYGAGRGREPGR